jgi:triacylglycerol esterase/lipase EstA (alpha/beta hydrolase family)
VDAIVQPGGAQAVVIVAHSMGGLVARACLARRGAGRVVRLVTLASPHNGTRLAKLGLGANARQMRPDSAFLEGLRRHEGANGPGCPVTSIYSVHDNLVSPQDTSRLPYARNIALSGAGHIDILRDARVHELVAGELEAAGVEFRPGDRAG